MADTPNLTLPLLAAAQAQKHVTVNEALTRLDGAVQMRMLSRDLTTPPGVAAEGDLYAVPFFAVNDWAGHDGEMAQYVNGGWVFYPPQRGWTGYVVDTGSYDIFDGNEWKSGGQSLTPGGAGLSLRSIEGDEVLGAGPTHTTTLVFPERSIVLGVTGRVTDPITGALSDWRVGDATTDDLFGNGLGLGLNSWVNGPATPFVAWSDTPLVLTGNGGDFAGGTVRLALHFMEFTLPIPV